MSDVSVAIFDRSEISLMLRIVCEKDDASPTLTEQSGPFFGEFIDFRLRLQCGVAGPHRNTGKSRKSFRPVRWRPHNDRFDDLRIEMIVKVSGDSSAHTFISIILFFFRAYFVFVETCDVRRATCGMAWKCNKRSRNADTMVRW